MTPDVEVYQHGMSQRHTARCGCGWEESTGSLKSAKDLAAAHRRHGCGNQEGVARPASQELVVPQRAAVPIGMWNQEQIEIVRRSVAAGCTDDELAFFAQVCRHKGLDPFAGEIVAIPRWDSRSGRNIMVIQETVAGLRALAERSGLYDGQDAPLWCGQDAKWLEVWLDTQNPPAAAKVAVWRKGWDRPTVGIARYSSYVQLDKNGKPTGLWRTGADFMLWKCAEAAALKRAFKHAFADAGISTRELSGPSLISLEARQAGLDDAARHELVAQITDGRTESTRELTDQEALEVRAEVARIRAEVGADPETGEIDEPVGAPDAPDAVARFIARGAGDLEDRMALLDETQTEQMKDWRRAQGLARPLRTLSPADRTRVSAELDRRGWGRPDDAEPTAEPTAEAEVVDGDGAMFGDEPF